jgi:signal transduction histidine kinase
MPAARLIERLQSRRLAVTITGIGIEGAVVGLLAAVPSIGDIRGIGGETAVIIAVLGAVAAGPIAGAAMALTGWAIFFPTIANARLGSIAALPLWVATALIVGLTSERLVRSERGRTRAQMQADAAHQLRTPVAVIHGMAQTLRKDELPLDQREKLLELIVHESDQLLSAPPFAEL